MNDWMFCSACDTEFNIVSDTEQIISFCPFCGSNLDDDFDELDDDE